LVAVPLAGTQVQGAVAGRHPDPESVACGQAAPGGFVLVPVIGAKLRRQVKLVAPQDPPGSAADRAFIGSVKEFPDTVDGASPVTILT
jgi:hypothetical protein